MNVVERTNPPGRMGKLEETEAGGEEVKGGKREGEGRPQGACGGKEGPWLAWAFGRRGPGSYRMGHSACKVNTTSNQATRASQLGKRGCLCYFGNMRVYLNTVRSMTASDCSCKTPVFKVLVSRLVPTQSTPCATRQLTAMIVSPLQPLPGDLVTW